MQFLGTAAADVLPGPLCDCPICRDARMRPNRRRLRSMFLLDPENLIDCGPDFAAAVMQRGVDVTALRNVFLTHTNDDHFCASNAGLIHMANTRTGKPVDLYLSEPAYAALLRKAAFYGEVFPDTDSYCALKAEEVRLHPVAVGIPFSAGGYEVTAVRTTHRVSATETALNYRVRQNGHSLLYASDTGLYPQESLELLQNSRLDVLIMEGTWGSRTDQPSEMHLNAYTFLEQMETFRKYGIITVDTQVFCTHINHKHDFNHEAYQAFFDAHALQPVTVAYDGLQVDWNNVLKEETETSL